jgi:hypothetical protein
VEEQHCTEARAIEQVADERRQASSYQAARAALVAVEREV